ncbi:PTS transporter subunit EIIC [Enterococcus sp.]|uniref:PTS transporter subunit EIIC n=1 Tax=Enterococcus sp. TaxID=35783 RepID=UPI002906739E|nr:PTS transporter subunit EIIC [Enterococcus sp.]MDU5334914.1 PTS transporter subunit EIIC [Enterococcus sp.]
MSNQNSKYDELAEILVELVGGKGNISFFTHCITRLRFNVKDKGLIEEKAIDGTRGVVGSQWQGDQFQIIIGQHVGEVYKVICEKIGYENKKEVSSDEIVEETGKKKFSIGKIFDAISGCMTPLLPLLIGGGMLKAILLILTQFSLISVESSTYVILSLVGDAAFYFLPVFVGATGARKFGANMGFGMLIGASLIHPQFLEAVASGTPLSVYGLPVFAANYSSTIIPMILSTFILSYVEKYVTKYTPKVLQSMAVPVVTLLIMIPLTFCLLAPLGSIIGFYLADLIMWLYNTTGFLAVGVTSAVYILLCLTGMHTAILPIGFTMLTTVGYDPLLFTGAILYTVNQGIVALIVAIRTKDVEERSTALTCVITALIAGISEPALFGFSLKNKKLFYSSMIGCLVGGLYIGITKTYAYALTGTAGLLALPGYVGPNSMNLVNMCIGIAISCVVTFALGMVFAYSKDSKEKNVKEKNVEVA